MIIKRLITGAIKIITLVLTIIIFGFCANSVFADTVDYNVNVAPSLKLTIPSSSIVLNLNPPTKTFDSEDFTVEVGTNNQTGYTLTLSTPNDDTFLNRDSSSDGVSAKLYTLDTGTYTETTFTPDKWGYSINSNTAIPSTITSGFVPFQSGNTLMESSTAVNHDETELTFAAKIDYLQPAGSYSTDLIFDLVANPLMDYIQDFTTEMCQEKASSANYTVVDKRDNQEYTVRYINGTCWMTRNLAVGCNGFGPNYGSSVVTGGKLLTSDETNISTDWTTPTAGLENGNSITIPYMTCNDTYGAWYNYVALTAGTITGRDQGVQTYDICPKGWRLATYTEETAILSYADAFNAQIGGYWYAGTIRDPSTTGIWVGSTASGYYRYEMYSLSSHPETLYTSYGGCQEYGGFARCVAK